MQTFQSRSRGARWRAISSSLLGAVLVGLAGPSEGQEFGRSPHAVPVVLPACDASDPEVRIIDDVDDWPVVNDPAARIFCVRPGSYQGAGSIRLLRSGTATEPRVLRHHDPDATVDLHPVEMAGSQRAIVRDFQIRGARHWLIDGLTVQGSDRYGVSLDDASDNVLNRLLVQRAEEGLVQFRGVSHRNVLQNSVIRRAVVAPDVDRGCVSFRDAGEGRAQRDNRLVQNEIYDCTDGIQLYLPSDATDGGGFPGLVIDENDVYLSRARYTNCLGEFDRQGPCGCAENGIDVKIGGAGSAPGQAVSITGNRVWGWRETDHGPGGGDVGRCGGTGSWGNLLSAHRQASHLSIRDNVFFDGPSGIGIGGGAHDVLVEDNVLHGIEGGWRQKGSSLFVGGPDNVVRRNVLVDLERWLHLAPTESRRTSLRCNVVVASGHAAGEPGSDSDLDYNSYYGTEPGIAAGPHDQVVEEAASAPGEPLCFWRKRWTGPERVCLAHGTYAVGPGLAASCQDPAPAAPVILWR
jgi:hypothetical protein